MFKRELDNTRSLYLKHSLIFILSPFEYQPPGNTSSRTDEQQSKAIVYIKARIDRAYIPKLAQTFLPQGLGKDEGFAGGGMTLGDAGSKDASPHRYSMLTLHLGSLNIGLP